MNGLGLAIQFLTRIPVRMTDQPTSEQIARSYYWYPIVGILVGCSAVLLRHMADVLLPAQFTIVLLLAYLAVVTGALHEDGLADVADGIGGRTREERLTIMRDSRIGTFGVLAVVLVILAKFAALTSMAPAKVDAALVSASVLSRWVFLPMGYCNPPAREGLGSAFRKGLTMNHLVLATTVSFATVGWLNGSRGTAIILFFAGTIMLTASMYFRRRLGGITGDCFGATAQLLEVGAYAAILI